MGQGIIAALAQICAEQLEGPFQDIDMVMGDTKRWPVGRQTSWMKDWTKKDRCAYEKLNLT